MTQMNVLVWINESTWPSCVAAARELAPAGASLTLLHVVDDAVPAAARGAFAGRDVRVEQRSGRVEREVVAAAEGMNLLVVARDGDLRRLGPHSLAPATRFVVDHAPLRDPARVARCSAGCRIDPAAPAAPAALTRRRAAQLPNHSTTSSAIVISNWSSSCRARSHWAKSPSAARSSSRRHAAVSVTARNSISSACAGVL